MERFEERLLLTTAPQLLSILTNNGDVVYSPSVSTQPLSTAPTELDFLFNEGQSIDPATLSGIQLVRAGTDHTLNTADDVAITPGFAGIGSISNQVVVRFSSTLPDDLYQITLVGSGPDALTNTSVPPTPFNNGGSNQRITFQLDSAPQVLSVVPEPVTRDAQGQLQQAVDAIDVYFNKPIQALPQNVNQLDPHLFQLVVTQNTADSTDDFVYTPATVSFDSTTNAARLTFAGPLSTLGTGAFRLRIGDAQSVATGSNSLPASVTVPVGAAGSTFGDTSTLSQDPGPYNLGSLNTVAHQILSGAGAFIGPVAGSPVTAYPGGNTGPGVRNIPIEQHVDPAAQQQPGQTPYVPTITYNFPTVYGSTPGNPQLFNAITPAQQQLARQIFQLYSNYYGVQFKEVSSTNMGDAQLGIVTGVVQALDPSAPASLTGIAQAPTQPFPATPPATTQEALAIMNASIYNQEGQYGGPWFLQAIRQIGYLLGLGDDTEGPPGTVMGAGGNDPATGSAPENAFPGNADILHGQYLYRPTSNDVQMYKFTVTTPGTFSAETIAQRLTDSSGNPTASSLNTVLTLYNEANVVQLPGTGSNPVGASIVPDSAFTLNDGTSPPVAFAFSTGYALQLPAATPGNLNGIQDGQQLVMSDGQTTITFDFYVDNQLPVQTTPGHVYVKLTHGGGIDQTAQAIAAAINGAGLSGFHASYANGGGGRIYLGGALNSANYSQFISTVISSGAVTVLSPSASNPSAVKVIYSPYATAHDAATSLAATLNNYVANHALKASAEVQFDRVILSGPLTLTHTASQGSVSYSIDREIVSRNDDYFGTDSYLKMQLGPGNYYVAVTSTGNTSFDPNVPNSGSGGTTAGEYNLSLDFTPAPISTLTDDGLSLIVPNVPVGSPGGIQNKDAFTVSDGVHTVKLQFVTPTTTPDPQSIPVVVHVGDGQDAVAQAILTALANASSINGLTPRYDQHGRVNLGGSATMTVKTLSSALTVWGTAARHAVQGNSDGDTGAFNFWFDSNDSATIFVDKLSPAIPDATLGTIANPYNTIAGALQAAADRIIAPAASLIAAHQTFTVSDGFNQPVVFEFSVDGSSISSGNVPVSISSADSPAMVAAEIYGAIEGAVQSGFLALSPSFAAPAAGSNIVDVAGAAFVDAKGTPAMLAATKIVRIVGNTGADNSLGVPILNAPNAATLAGNQQTFSVTAGSVTAVFEFTTNAAAISPTTHKLADGNYGVLIAANSTAQAIANAMAAAINASALANASGGAVVASVVGDAVAFRVVLTGVGQITINAQNTPSLITASNAQPYLLGHDQFTNQPLADGGDLTVPQGVTVMIDAGAVLKLQGANINVGLNSPNVDRSNSALQVLGTPSSSVYFTSFHDNGIGGVTDPVGTASPGDWGGIVYHHASDLEQHGIFVNNVNHAKLSYAGGTVVVGGIPAVYNAIYLDGSRPAIAYNTITNSFNAAMSADPNSFQETIYGSPAYDPVTGRGGQAYVADYNRTGPDIRGNTLSVDASGALALIAVDGSHLIDGETFVLAIPNGAGGTIYQTFEFDSNNSVSGGNIAVKFKPGNPAQNIAPDSAASVAAAIATAINGAGLAGVSATAKAVTAGSQTQQEVFVTGASAIKLPSSHTFNAPAGNAVVDGQTFVVTNPDTGVSATFEFDNNASVAPGHIAIAYLSSDTAATLAGKIAAAISGGGIGTLAMASGSSVTMFSASSFSLTASAASGLTASQQSLIFPNGSALVAGSTFTVLNPAGSSIAVFEFTTDASKISATTGKLADGNYGILYTKLETAATIAARAAKTINDLGIGTTAIASGGRFTLVAFSNARFTTTLSLAARTVGNTVNGLFVRTQNFVGQTPQTLNVPARFTSTDIVYVVSDNLVIQGNPGGLLDNAPRMSGRLAVDPGVVVKLLGSRIEVQMGASLIAEGTASRPVTFTSLRDDSFGAGGTFDTNGDNFNVSAPPSVAKPGDWAGLYFSPTSRGSLDHALLAYGGGSSTIEGGSDNFNVVEIRQAQVRIADSTLENNAAGLATTSTRGGRLGNDSAAIYVLGAQPVIVNNVLLNNLGAAISINANSLTSDVVPDTGRSTGPISRFDDFDDNQGPLVRQNRIGNVIGANALNGMLVRGATLDTSSVWDDTDIVHVVESQIIVPNVDTRGGLMLKSSATASLVVKFEGSNAGLTASGQPLDITDRIGGSVQIVGTPNHNVVLTALSDATVGAGFTPDGSPQNDTKNTGPVKSDNNPTFPPSGGQLTVTPSNNATALVNSMLLRTLPTGVTVSGATFTGGATEAGTYVNGDGVPLQIPQKGALLTTGNANLPAQNNSGSFGADLGLPGDANLSSLINGVATHDAAVLTFTVNVDPASGIKSGAFEFQFGSEEFPTYVGKAFNDILAAWINGNPATNFLHDSKGNLVSINNAFFDIDNSVQSAGKYPLNVEYNGMTSGLIATFPLQPGLNTITIAIADVGDGFYDSGVFLTDLHFSTQPVGAGGVSRSGATAGDWQGITLDQYSNDRNVATVNEAEPASTGGVDANSTIAKSQYLGVLAPNQYAGDDTQRLGFVVNGVISPNAPGDVDMYSFKAQPGTQVWIDLGNTSPGLDTVVELVDDAGTVVARSDDSVLEASNPSLLQQELANNHALPMQSNTLLQGIYDPNSQSFPGMRDLNSTNPHDSGFRVVLTSETSGQGIYYVRVRSKGTDQHYNDLNGGTSSGSYQLQIRLREEDEYAGSTVQNADIRFATNGINIIGLPAHSPLVSEAGSGTNHGSFGTAQDLGNLLTTDLNTIGVSGNLAAGAQDWYKFELNYNLAQVVAGINNGDKTFSTIFDIDYADGIARPNTTISIFDASGNLIYVGRDSNVGNDQAASNSSTTDLSRGSSGQLDPFIGSVQLPTGPTRTYYVAISSDASLPTALDAAFLSAASQPLIRLEPIDSVNRVIEDHIGSQGGETAQDPQTLTSAFNGDTTTQAGIDTLNTYATPFTLADVGLFVQTAGGGGHLHIVNPSTGQEETDVGTTIGSGFGYSDIAMRNDGQLYAFTNGTTDGNSGLYQQISTGNASVLSSNSDGIKTYQFNNATPPALVVQNIGLQFDALAFNQETGATGRQLYAVGHRAGGNRVGAATNLLYQLDPNTGLPISNPGTGRYPTDALEQGTIRTGAGNGVSILTLDGSAFSEGQTFTVTDRGTTVTFEFDSGFTLTMPAAGGAGIPNHSILGVSDGTKTVAFDFSQPGTGSGFGTTPILYLTSDTPAQLANRILNAINAAGFTGFSPTLLPNGRLNLGGNQLTSIDVSGVPQITLAGSPGAQTPGAIAVPFVPSTTFTAQQVANALVGAIQSAPGFGTLSVSPGNNQVNITDPTAPPSATNPVSFNRGSTALSQLPVTAGPGGSVTGIAFADDGNLYAVSDAGGFYEVDPSTAQTRFIATVTYNGTAIHFSALTPAPENVAGGAYKGLLFATDTNGNLYALNVNGVLQPVFAGNALSVSTGQSNVVGLAFSTLDYNLWHVTDNRGADAGHGINVAPDASRNASSANQPQPGNSSFYFGLEPPSTVDPNSLNANSQPDAANYASNTSVYHTYDLPGGAHGSLKTNSFSLADYSAGDKPTLYFNYYLSARQSSSTTQNPGTMVDSARVFISADGGVTWQMLATNDSALAKSNTDPNAELPSYLSASSNTGSGDSRQQVQQLFDNTGAWRQARIDLGNYAGRGNLMLRFDFSTAGTMNEPGLPGDSFGNLASNLRGQDNGHEGFYVDDITVGFAERGEMVTGATPNTNFSSVPQNPNPGAPTQVLSGAYQLEIRRGTTYGATVDSTAPDISLTQTFDTNDRLASGFTIIAPAGSAIVDGQTFTVSDATHTVTFEFDNNGSVAAGNVRVPYASTYNAAQVANAIAKAVNANLSLKGVAAGTVSNPVTTITAPSGSTISDGQTFTIRDLLGNTATFEYNTAGGVQPGNIAVPVQNSMSSANVAAAIAAAISGAPQLSAVTAFSAGSLVTVTQATSNHVEFYGASDLSSINAVQGLLSISFSNSPATPQNHGSVAENGGSTTIYVSSSAPVGASTLVTLSAVDVANALLGLSTPSNHVTFQLGAQSGPTIHFTIAGGSTVAVTVFGVETLNQGGTAELPDGPQAVALTARAAGYASDSATIDVLDDPDVFPKLSVSLNTSTIAENSTTPVTGTVSFDSPPLDHDLVVNLRALNPEAASVPATVVIPAGQTSATFAISPLDNNVIHAGGVQQETILAYAIGFMSGSAPLTVADDGDGQFPAGVGPLYIPEGPSPASNGQTENIVGANGASNPVSGGIQTVLADPSNPNVLYLGAVNGGVWKTTNALAAGGPTWTPLTDNLPSLSIGAMAFDKSDTTNQTLIAGIGRFSSFAQAGGVLSGLLRSIDGGQTWAQINPTGVFNGQNITSVAERGNVIIVGTDASLGSTGALYVSTDGGNVFVQISGLLNSGLPVGAISDLAEDPNDPNRFYAGVLGANGGIFTSANAGQTWTNITPAGLTLNANATDDTLKISVSAIAGSPVFFGYVSNGQLAAIYRSANQGTSWQAMDVPTTIENGTTIGLEPGAGDSTAARVRLAHFTIAADPINGNIVYVGGDRQPGPGDGAATFPNSLGANAFSGRLFRGNAAQAHGSQWSSLTNSGTRDDTSPHANSRDLIFVGNSLVEADDGGIYLQDNPRTSNGSWSSLNGNLQIGEIYSIAYDTNTHTIVAGTQGTGTVEQDGVNGLGWTQTTTGVSGGAVAVDNSDPNLSIRYTSSQHLANFLESTYDSNNNLVGTPIQPPLIVNNSGGLNIYQVDPDLPYVTTVAINAIDPTRLVIGGENAVYESNNRGNTLTALNVGGAGPGAAFGASIAYGGRIVGPSGSVQNNPDVLWVGVGSNVYLRTGVNGPLAATNYPGTGVRSLVIDPNNWHTAFVADDSGHVYMTTDQGATYTDISFVAGNPTAPSSLTQLTSDLHTLAFVPGSPGTLFVGAQDGIYSTQIGSGGGSGVWTQYGVGLPHTPVYSLQYVPSEQVLIVGTMGRGAFIANALGLTGDITVTVNGLTSVNDDAGVLFGKLTVSRSGGSAGDLSVHLVSSNPDLASVPATVVIPDGQTSITVDVTILDSVLATYPYTVVFTGSVGGLNSISSSLDIVPDGDPNTPTDNDTPELTVTIPPGTVIQAESVNSTALGTVTRNTPTDLPLTVTLYSSDPTQASTPVTVVIPAGQASATFPISAFGQFQSQGSRTISITAVAQGFASGAGSLVVESAKHILAYDRVGDPNLLRQQGQIIIQGNKISNSLNYGIVVSASPRDAATGQSIPGAPLNLSSLNAARLAPGATIVNNLIVGGGQGGIQFLGDSNPAGDAAAVVPFGRIINNTIYGQSTRTGIGIQVGQNASPTILNNIFANLATGISVDNTSSTTVAQRSVYQNNGTNLSGQVAGGFDFGSLALSPTDKLFTNPGNGDFYLVAGSLAIDSSLNQILERASLSTVKSSAGIPNSPINAPAYDLYGQLRVALGQTTPGGVGASQYIDRGAIDSVDGVGPTTTLANPIDDDSLDQDPAFAVIHEVGSSLPDFAIQLVDSGVGIDDSTVDSSKFVLYRNGVLLQSGIDYFFRYDSNTKIVRFTPATGTWLNGNTYTIAVNNGAFFDPFNTSTPATNATGIKDLAGNLLNKNSLNGYTRYDILLQNSGSQAPTIGVPGVQSMLEHGLNDLPSDHKLVFSSTGGNPIMVFDIESSTNPVTVTLSTQNGTLLLATTAGLSNVSGNNSSVISFTGSLTAVNAALNGLTFSPTLYFYGTATINISATDTVTQLTGSNSVDVNVTQVNQAPSATFPASPSTLENQGLTFSTASGNAITVSDPDALSTDIEQVTLTASHGTITLGTKLGITILSGTGVNDLSVTFQGTLSQINAALNGLLFRPDVYFAGIASISFTLNDLGHTGNGPQGQPGTFPQTSTTALNINVTPVDQAPFVKVPNPLDNLVVNENSPPTVINLTQVFADPDTNNPVPENFPSISVTGNSNAAIVSATIDPVTHLLTLTYGANQSGVAILTLTATDAGPSHQTSSHAFTITVKKIELAPVANNDSYVYSVNAPLVVGSDRGVLANDVELNHEPMSAVLFDWAAHGNVTVNPDGSFTYTPEAGFDGRDHFVYKADNGTFRTAATVTVDSPNSRWVARMYSEVLGRSTTPGDAEVNYWVGQLDHGVSRQQVSDFFVTSAERRSQLISQLYLTYLGRAVDQGGLNYWLSVWNANQGPEQVQAGIIGSAEYFNTAASELPSLSPAAAWVTKLYENLLHRDPGPSEVAYWTNFIQTHSRQSVVLGFVTSDEYRLGLMQGIPDFPGQPHLQGWYMQYLHRPIDDSGAQYWLQRMKSGYPQEAIVEGILASAEYYNRP